MKKILIFFLSILIGNASLFANDVQIGLSGPSLFFYDGALLGLDCRTHTYFDKNNRYGIELAALYTPFTMENDIKDFEFLTSFFIGPCATFMWGKSVRFTAATGFKYLFDLDRVKDKDFYSGQNPDENLIIIDEHFYHGFAWAFDLQLKFFADKKYSIAVGVPFAIGKGLPVYWQTPISDNPESHYITLKSDNKFESFIDFETFYLMFCWNL